MARSALGVHTMAYSTTLTLGWSFFAKMGSAGSASSLPISSFRYAARSPVKYHSSFSLVASFSNVILRPGHNTALALSTWRNCGTENLSLSKNFGSGQKRTVVPVLRWPTVPTTSSFEETLPSLKLMLYSLPLRLIQHSSCFDSALTTDTPTPCRPPETSYVLSLNFPPACRRVRISSTPDTFSFGWMSTGMPRPSSATDTELSLCSVTLISLACPASASSTELSTTSCARWLGRVVSVYMPGRRRTGSRPDRTSISDAV